MAALYEFWCSGYDFETHFALSAGFYVVPDGTKVTMRCECGWCSSRGLSTIEQLPTEEELKQTLADIDTDAPWMARVRAGWARLGLDATEAKARLIADTEERLALSKIRKAPPHCLACGGIEFKLFEWGRALESLPVRHPGCGGDLVGRRAGHARKALLQYHPEGYLLPRT